MAENRTGAEAQPEPQSWQGRLPFFYGWVIVVIAFMMSFMTAGVGWSTSVIAVPMREDLGWSLSSIYLGLTMRGLVGAVGMFLLGRFADLKHGARSLAVVSGGLSAMSLLAISQVESHWQFLLLYGGVGGMTQAGTGFLIMSAVVPRWFFRRRGRAVAFATMGSGAAAFILPPVMAFILESVGWRGTWVGLAALTAMFTILPAFLIWRQPEDVGLVPDGGIEPIPANRAAAVQHVRNYTTSEALKSSVMWVLILGVAAASLSPNGVPASLVPMYIDKGHTTQVAALGFSIYGLFSMLARFFWGFLAERYHIRNVIIGIGVFTGIVMPLLIFVSGNPALLYSALAGFGIGGFIGTQTLVWPGVLRANAPRRDRGREPSLRDGGERVGAAAHGTELRPNGQLQLWPVVYGRLLAAVRRRDVLCPPHAAGGPVAGSGQGAGGRVGHRPFDRLRANGKKGLGLEQFNRGAHGRTAYRRAPAVMAG